MKRWLLLVGVLLLVAMTAISVLVNVRSEISEPLPEPDPAMPILMADGSELPLADVLDRVQRDVPLPLASTSPPELEVVINPDTPMRFSDGTAMTLEDIEKIESAVREGIREYRDRFGPTFALAHQREADGDYDQAIALYLSIKEAEPGYAYSRRRVGWHILAKQGQAARGVRYVQQALIADPLNGNSWQDFARVYGRTLGIPVD